MFLGTVTEVNGKAGDFKRAQMHIDHVYKGTLKEMIELFDDGMCDGPNLEIGRQYLMYTTALSPGVLPARGCTRSRRVEDADEDLQFLKEYDKANTKTHVSGKVRFQPDEPDEPDDIELGERGSTPIKGATVTLTSGERELHTITDAAGDYSFIGLTPGEYEIGAELPGYRLDRAPDGIRLRAGGCAQANLLMTVDRRVYGVVRDEKGAPVQGALVEMVSTDRRLKRWQKPVLLDISTEDGTYVIGGIPPGDYYLGVNIGSTPTREHPYATTYYPNTSNAGEAMTVAVIIGASEQEFDLRVSEKLPIIEVQGRVLNADGKPPILEDRTQVRFKEPGLYGQIEQEGIDIDAEGRFRFRLCEGIRYSAFAFAGPPGRNTYSAPIEFIPTKENNVVELILNKSQEEFNKLRRAMSKGN